MVKFVSILFPKTFSSSHHRGQSVWRQVFLWTVFQTLYFDNVDDDYRSTQVGLYTALMGGVIYTFLGTVKQVSIGPTSLMSLLTYEYTKNLPPEYVVLLTFMCGIVEMFMGLLKLGEFSVCNLLRDSTTFGDEIFRKQ